MGKNVNRDIQTNRAFGVLRATGAFGVSVFLSGVLKGYTVIK